jgi:hypothetical protein
MPTRPLGAQAYLKPGRLSDVIAALQELGAGERPEGQIDSIATRLSRVEDPTLISHWSQVFAEHQEFFLVYTLPGESKPKVALRLRYASKQYDPMTETFYKKGEIPDLPEDVRFRLTTKPLAGDAIDALISTAIQLYGSAAAERSDRRWWIPVFAALLGFAGALGGSLLSPLLSALLKIAVPK